MQNRCVTNCGIKMLLNQNLLKIKCIESVALLVCNTDLVFTSMSHCMAPYLNLINILCYTKSS